jgi:hypothetical protein
MATLIPSLINTSAMPYPIPFEPPVIRAVFVMLIEFGRSLYHGFSIRVYSIDGLKIRFTLFIQPLWLRKSF